MTTPAAQQALPPEMAEQLARLRDIHLPDAVSWWPLAPGWWALLVIVLVAAACLLGLELKRRRSLKYRALKELEELKRARVLQQTPQELASELCVLVRRIMLSQVDGRRYANTHGEAWGQYLATAPDGMPEKIAQFIAAAPYARRQAANDPGDDGAPDAASLVAATEQWIRGHA
jgi:hypothetical protein